MRLLKSKILLVLVIASVVSSIALGQDDSTDLSFYKPLSNSDILVQPKADKVKNIIFLIGDGMGVSVITAARIRGVGADGSLYIDRMPITGLQKNYASNQLVTDSAAAGTALACGVKTNNGTIGQTPNGDNYYSAMSLAKMRGLRTGTVSTSSVQHATPASFYAHVLKRSNYNKISEDLMKSNLDVVFGGGLQYLLPLSDENSKREDEKDLLALARENGYIFAYNYDLFKKVKGNKVLGLFQYGHLSTFDPEPSIKEMTEKAIDLLDKGGNGFFLMVEGSQIDWGSHDNDADVAIRQMLLFDLAINEALKFAEKDGETLVVVTADHETGGFSTITGETGSKNPIVTWSTKSHTGQMVPLFAYGPGAELFMGVQENTDIAKKMATLLNITDFPRKIEK